MRGVTGTAPVAYGSRVSEPPQTPPARYLPREGIASGGTAEVVAAWDVQLHREVALKLLRSDKPGARARFVAEAQVAAQLEHPNIIPVHDSGTTADGRVSSR